MFTAVNLVLAACFTFERSKLLCPNIGEKPIYPKIISFWSVSAIPILLYQYAMIKAACQGLMQNVMYIRLKWIRWFV